MADFASDVHGALHAGPCDPAQLDRLLQRGVALAGWPGGIPPETRPELWSALLRLHEAQAGRGGAKAEAYGALLAGGIEDVGIEEVEGVFEAIEKEEEHALPPICLFCAPVWCALV